MHQPMRHLSTFKVIIVLVVCFSTTLFANMQNNDPINPKVGTPTTQTPGNLPTNSTGGRGQLLYENHCTTCHNSGIHIRKLRKARSLVDIRKWVFRWSQQLNLEWTTEEINDVVDFLNRRFYQFETLEIDEK